MACAAARRRRAHRLRKTPQPLGDLPLVVLTRGKPARNANAEAAHVAEQDALAMLSRNSSHETALISGHHIPIEQPELVVSAVREVLGRVVKN
jgi:hypothetical protein